MGGGGIWTLAVTCLLLLPHAEVLGFGILPGESQNHLEITEEALLNVTVQTCRAISQAEGADFTAPASPFTAKSVAAACGAPKSSKSLKEAITLIQLMNVRVDIRYVLNASFHFDDEHINEGRAIITSNLQAVKAANKQENYEAARQALGTLMHSLQDFYSHSNWVELNFVFPNPNLIRSDTSVGNIAAPSRATCRSCDGDDCTNNILEDIISDRVLTTGYFSLNPLAEKPAGKCSHGGAVDLTSSQVPTGGINKDSLTADHGHLHTKAASLATAATSQMLEDVRAAAGDQPFLQMMGVTKGSSRALCIVIDVTESMSDDIQAVRNVTASIIEQAGAANAPALYILVPFSDPDVGPLVRTTDPSVFKSVINSLSVSGGSDDAEKSLSGLQVALNAAPKSSEVFLFTDAPAKDRNISSTVIALMERRQTVVNFMVTNSTVTNRKTPRAVSDSDLEVYQQLSQVSGGQTVEVRSGELQTAANIIMETSNLSPVTLLQVSRSPGRTQEFSFQVDETLSNLRVFITGRSVTVTVTNPSGSSQVSGSSGSVISSSQTVGNFQSLKLNNTAGAWKIKMESSNPYTLKVLGQSDLDFLFDFVQPSSGSFGGFDVLDTRPLAGVNGTLLVSVTGSDVATLTEASLVESSGSATVPGALALQDDGSYLVTLSRIPLDPFVVRVTGSVDGVSTRASKVFQRQSPTTVRGSNLTITAQADAIIVPGRPFTVPFKFAAGRREQQRQRDSVGAPEHAVRHRRDPGHRGPVAQRRRRQLHHQAVHHRQHGHRLHAAGLSAHQPADQLLPERQRPPLGRLCPRVRRGRRHRRGAGQPPSGERNPEHPTGPRRRQRHAGRLPGGVRRHRGRAAAGGPGGQRGLLRPQLQRRRRRHQLWLRPLGAATGRRGDAGGTGAAAAEGAGAAVRAE